MSNKNHNCSELAQDGLNPCGVGEITAQWLVQSKYNYPLKVRKAIEENNTKYIEMLIKKGKLIII